MRSFCCYVISFDSYFQGKALVKQVQRDPGVGLVFTAWSLAEVVRYPWYLSMLLETPSPRLTWLR